jgi:hypothetical protein
LANLRYVIELSLLNSSIILMSISSIDAFSMNYTGL